MKLFIATHNPNKIREFRQLLPGWEIVAEDTGAEETASTFSGNALIKARSLAVLHPAAWVLADDSGLEVFALGGEPGVRSARYSQAEHPEASASERTRLNNEKLLARLSSVTDRSAQFTCAIALISPTGRVQVVEGHCPGTIALAPSGTGGFGYDPLFIPEGYNCSFAELSAEAKNAVSHRGRALAAAVKLLR